MLGLMRTRELDIVLKIKLKSISSEKNIFLNKKFFVRKESTTQQIETPEDYQNYLDQKIDK